MHHTQNSLKKLKNIWYENTNTNHPYYLSSTNKQQETRMEELPAKVKDEKKIAQEGIRED